MRVSEIIFGKGSTRLPLNTAELQSCVELAPFWALARWQNRLNPRQIEDCVRDYHQAAVMFATDRILPDKRHAYLSKHPEAALTHATEGLTDEELGICAYEEKQAGLRHRGALPAGRQAIVLANVFPLTVQPNAQSLVSVAETEKIISLSASVETSKSFKIKMNYDHACLVWTPEDEDIATPSQGTNANSDDGLKVHSNLEQSELQGNFCD